MFRFSSGSLDPSRNRLTVGDQQRRLEPKLVDVLVCLLERAGEVVPKAELLGRVWRGSVVSDEALTAAIYALRKALGDSARAPRFIETIPQRGYQWLPPVQWEARENTGNAGGQAAQRLVVPRAQIAQRQGARLLDQRAYDRALVFLEQATQEQPGLVAPHASLALLYSQLAALRPAQRLDLYYKARMHAERARGIDEDAASTQLALGVLALLFDWDLERARSALEAAVDADPNDPNGHQFLSWLLSIERRHEGAVQAGMRAIELDPTVPSRFTDLAFAHLVAGEFDASLTLGDEAVALDPSDPVGHESRSYSLYVLGRMEEALAAHIASLKLSEPPPAIQELLDRPAGDLEEHYRRYLAALPKDSHLIGRAGFELDMGEEDKALDLLERAVLSKEPMSLWLSQLPEFGRLHANTRFQELIPF